MHVTGEINVLDQDRTAWAHRTQHLAQECAWILQMRQEKAAVDKIIARIFLPFFDINLAELQIAQTSLRPRFTGQRELYLVVNNSDRLSIGPTTAASSSVTSPPPQPRSSDVMPR